MMIVCLAGAEKDSETSLRLKQILDLNNFKDEEIFNLIKESIAYIESLQNNDDDLILKEVNNIYINVDKNVNNEFMKDINENFHANIETIEFNNVIVASQAINNLCEKKTQHKIYDFVDTKKLNGKTFILIDAIYFKATWLYPFTNNNVTFYMENGEMLQVTMSQMNQRFKMTQNVLGLEGASICQLPYKRDNLFMTIILPKQIETFEADEIKFIKLSDLENKLDFSSLLKKAFNRECLTEVEIHLPKFKIEYESEVNCFLFFL